MAAKANKHPGGRPGHEPTEALRKKVKQHAALGCTHEDIARVMGFSVDTLTRHYRHELDVARVELNSLVAGKLARAATASEHTGPTITAAIYWTKTQMGWKEASTLELTGKDGGPVSVEHSADEAFAELVSALDTAARSK